MGVRSMSVNCFSMHGMDMLGTGMRKTRHFLSIKFLFSYYMALNHVLLIKSWILIENLNISLLGIYRLIPRDTSVGSQDALPLSRKHNKDAGPGILIFSKLVFLWTFLSFTVQKGEVMSWPGFRAIELRTTFHEQKLQNFRPFVAYQVIKTNIFQIFFILCIQYNR
jgi:hypothetical protein